jgi:ABC-type multidrug transport system fused ATPase/permease subunit
MPLTPHACTHTLRAFQDTGFFDTTKTGEITSRLAADTSVVADQICLQLNVMLRSFAQASMVLVFMFSSSWRLTVVTFILVPAVLVITKVCVGARCGAGGGAVVLLWGEWACTRPSLLSAWDPSVAPLRVTLRPMLGMIACRSVQSVVGPSAGPHVAPGHAYTRVFLQVYGRYYRKMSKKVQAELAGANSTAEEALSTATTVR